MEEAKFFEHTEALDSSVLQRLSYWRAGCWGRRIATCGETLSVRRTASSRAACKQGLQRQAARGA